MTIVNARAVKKLGQQPFPCMKLENIAAITLTWILVWKQVKNLREFNNNNKNNNVAKYSISFLYSNDYIFRRNTDCLNEGFSWLHWILAKYTQNKFLKNDHGCFPQLIFLWLYKKSIRSSSRSTYIWCLGRKLRTNFTQGGISVNWTDAHPSTVSRYNYYHRFTK